MVLSEHPLLEGKFERIALDLKRRAEPTPSNPSSEEKNIKACFVVGKRSENNLKIGNNSMLHPEEQQALESIKSKPKQEAYALGRLACKVGLQSFEPDLEPKSIAIKNGTFAYPLICGPTKEPYEVSISHSGDLACALVFEAGHPMGIDLERRDANRRKAYERLLTTKEEDLTSQLSKTNGSSLLYANLLWTIKEAISKTVRCGFTTPHHIWELKTIKQKDCKHNNCYRVTFQNFFQFKAYSIVGREYLLSICLPRKTKMNPSCLRDISL